MAIYHFTAKVISRSKGRSAVAAAAYRSASEIRDYRQDLTFDYAAKPDVIHSEILAPEGAPQWVHDRELLWNAVEAGEKRRDAQVAREVEFALPEELNRAEAIPARAGVCRARVCVARHGCRSQRPLGPGQPARARDAHDAGADA